MPLIYAGGQWRNVPLRAQANVEPVRAPRYVSGEGSIISQAPDLYRPGRDTVVPTPAPVVPINPPPPPDGGGGNNNDTDRATTPAPVVDPAQAQRDFEMTQLGQTLEAYFSQFGLNEIAAWAKQAAKDGFSAEWIKFNARNQESYKRRFPAMQRFLDMGAGFTEQDYINYEQLARNLDQQYGMPDNMIYKSVTNLLNNDVDAEELSDRAAMASAAAIQAPEDFKQTMRDFYGIDEGGLTAYFLDPSLATDSLKKQSVAAQSGAIAARQGIPNVGRELAEDLYDRGVRDEEEMMRGYSQANQLRGLSTGKANTVDQEQLIRGSFGDSAAEEAVAKVSRIRRASNRGGGGYVGGESGASGLGSASY